MGDRRGRIESDSLAPVDGTTLREGALASAFIDAATFDRVVDRRRMV